MTKRIYIIAGEASGDVIGGQLVASLRAQLPDLELHGIGGSELKAKGLTPLFDMHEIALMGFAEVLVHLFRLKKRLRETVEDILAKQPDMVITIDSPGFTFRVVKALRKRGFSKPCVHYVAPTVWAYKPERAAKTAALFDALLCILPFEPAYFTKHGLKAVFIGHPIAWLYRQKGDGAAFRRRCGIAQEAVVIGMMPGSRRGELARHLPIFRKAAEQLHKSIPSLRIIMPVNDDLRTEIAANTKRWRVPVTLTSPSEKRGALAACNLALAKSGTVALECSLAQIPLVVAFKTSAISAFLVRRLIRVPYVNLMNLLAHFNRAPAPISELLQENCTPETISSVLLKLHQSQSAQHAQISACERYFEQLGMMEERSPSDKAAAFLCEKFGLAAS